MSEQENRDYTFDPESLRSEEAAQSFDLDDLIRSTKEEIARVDALMGSEEPKPQTGSTMPPLFEPELPQEYADLSLDEETPEEEEEYEPEPEPVHLLAPGLRALLYVCCVLAASVLLAVAAWKCADDVLALTSPDEIVTVTVPENGTISELTEQLTEKGLVQYGWLFQFYCWFSHAEQKIDPGTYELNKVYDYHALVSGMIETAGERAVQKVMIPEGYECADIFRLLDEKGVCTVKELEDAAANHAFDYDFLLDLPYGAANRLEGYLFPDTYEFYVGDDAVNVIDKFLRNFRSKVNEDHYTALNELNARLREKMRADGFNEAQITAGQLTMNDIITVASLVEKETAKTSESASIASVIYNRLCSQLYPCLEIDAAIQYVLAERKDVLTNADKSILSPYNTYTNPGLPAGPIANPGMASIRAALYPADTEYYFYALGKSGTHHFSKTYYEHLEFLAEMESETNGG